MSSSALRRSLGERVSSSGAESSSPPRRIDPRAGNLDYGGPAPWLAWGAYLWANGTKPRSDGLVWQCSDTQSDGTHPSATGQEKVAELLLKFFKVDQTANTWFVR